MNDFIEIIKAGGTPLTVLLLILAVRWFARRDEKREEVFTKLHVDTISVLKDVAHSQLELAEAVKGCAFKANGSSTPPVGIPLAAIRTGI